MKSKKLFSVSLLALATAGLLGSGCAHENYTLTDSGRAQMRALNKFYADGLILPDEYVLLKSEAIDRGN